jgi:DNA-binding MarR family transcriptional regulator
MFVENSPENLKNTREDLLQKTIEQLFRVVRHVHRGVSPNDPGLSHPQARLVFAIAKYKDEGVSVKDLARISNMTPGAITQFVDVLITKDLVKREEDPGDRRIVRLKLTPNAKDQMKKFQKEFLASASRAFSVLSTSELTQLIDILTKVSPAVCDDHNHTKIFEGNS